MKVTKKIRLGFTLPEVLLSLTLLSIIAGMIIPMYRTFIVRNDLDSSVAMLAQNLRRAQALSQAGDGDTGWGVHVGVGSILVYKGSNYITRDSLYDENTSIPTSIAPTGLVDVTFSKVTGMPSATGTFMLTSQNNEKRNVTINEKGMVDY
jgi:prepilin-type N-terminal cleavage/methylation domain-containing protein